MNITPRVPRSILVSLQETLSNYYPEYSSKIKEWKSENTASNVDIRWDRIYSYSQMFDQASQKIDEFGETNTMVLTFSSAITVKGALGDVARFRMNLSRKYNVNKNHKKIEVDKLFLSTANSSKGLERDHVLVFLTFPLEKAFSCFLQQQRWRPPRPGRVGPTAGSMAVRALHTDQLTGWLPG